MTRDPIVTEVRRLREQHAARFDYDLRRIFEDLKRSEATRDRELSPLLAPKEGSESLVGSSVQRARFASR